MLNIQEPTTTTQPTSNTLFSSSHAFWNFAFRPGFLLASLWAIFAIIVWVAGLSGYSLLGSGVAQPSALLPLHWHIHEMIFGVFLTIAVSFLLTAVQTWTQVPTVKGYALSGLFTLWVLIRVALWAMPANYLPLIIGLQSCWWALAIIWFSQRVLKANNWRNAIFIPLLTLLACANVLFLYAEWQQHFELLRHMARSALLVFAVVVSIIAGRVIPFFTQRGLSTATTKQHIAPTPILDKLLLLSSLCGTLSFIAHFWLTPPVPMSLWFAIAALLHSLRLVHWKPQHTWRHPLLWSLHLAYLCLALSYAALSASELLPTAVTFSQALHLLTVGAMGSLIVSMMTRVSLGHTGRQLIAPPLMPFAFGFMLLATLSRVVLPALGWSHQGWLLAAIFWSLAFGSFVVSYRKILLSPRVNSVPK